MSAEIIMPIIYFVCLLILVGPHFLDTNSSLKQFLSNLSIWALIVIVITLSYQAYNYLLKFFLFDRESYKKTHLCLSLTA